MASEDRDRKAKRSSSRERDRRKDSDRDRDRGKHGSRREHSPEQRDRHKRSRPSRSSSRSPSGGRDRKRRHDEEGDARDRGRDRLAPPQVATEPNAWASAIAASISAKLAASGAGDAASGAHSGLLNAQADRSASSANLKPKAHDVAAAVSAAIAARTAAGGKAAASPTSPTNARSVSPPVSTAAQLADQVAARLAAAAAAAAAKPASSGSATSVGSSSKLSFGVTVKRKGGGSKAARAGWSLDNDELEDDDEEENDERFFNLPAAAAPTGVNGAANGVAAGAAAAANGPGASRNAAAGDEAEVDPLDAFMHDLGQAGPVVEQESASAAPVAGGNATKAPSQAAAASVEPSASSATGPASAAGDWDVPSQPPSPYDPGYGDGDGWDSDAPGFGANVITLEEIMAGVKRKGPWGAESGAEASDAERVAIGGAFDDDDDADEARMEQEKREFMEEMRRQHELESAGGGNERIPELKYAAADSDSEEAAIAAAAKAAAAAAAALVPLGGSVKPEPEEAAAAGGESGNGSRAAAAASEGALKREEELGRIWEGEGDMLDESEVRGKEKDVLQVLAEQLKKKELKPVDHSTVDYIPIRKNLYIVPRLLAQLSLADVNKRRADMEIKVRGKGCPPPVEVWEQCGLSDRVLAIIRRLQFKTPFPIQRQAVPAIMSGRDVIGVAKTGSGKTLAFVLPMLRHILDQPPLAEGEGPIGLIMAPARELAVQIYNEAKRFTKALGLRVVAVYGGAGVADQIAEMKRGADIVVCTPGRMIDILTMQAGKLVSLKRVSFVVMDEADRMFDMGFEPQIRMIVQNVRPDRQTVLFSATFPQKVEQLAKKVLKLPLEIIVGGRSVASSDITQHVEVREEDDKYMRLLQLLGVWYERGQVLVFVDTQQKCDSLFSDLTRSGYPLLSLHGGKDQNDRDATISDFKTAARTLMVATSVAGRGLDVPDLVCVINYSCPNHLEDYVHRVGRTGRAGRKGTAYTFISPEEEQHAPMLCRALTQANQEVPKELKDMATNFEEKVKRGEARWANAGFSGKGFTFDDSEKSEEQKMRDLERRQAKIDMGIIEATDGQSEKEQKDLELRLLEADDNPMALAVIEKTEAEAAAANAAADAAAGGGGAGDSSSSDPLARARAAAAAVASSGGGIRVPPAPVGEVNPEEALRQAKMIARQLGLGPAGGEGEPLFEDEIEINDYPQQARWRATQRSTINQVFETTGAAIITKGVYCPPGKQPPAGERKLTLLIQATTPVNLKNARAELQRILNEETLKGVGFGRDAGKYSVV